MAEGCFINYICPAGTGFRRLAEFGTPARRADLEWQKDVSLIISALRAHYFAVRQSLGRLRGARQGGAGYGATPPSRPPLHPPRSTPKEGFQLP